MLHPNKILPPLILALFVLAILALISSFPIPPPKPHPEKSAGTSTAQTQTNNATTAPDQQPPSSPTLLSASILQPLLSALSSAAPDTTLALPLPDGSSTPARINLVTDDQGTLRIGGNLTEKNNATFSLSLTPENKLLGQILLYDEDLALIIETDDTGTSTIQTLPLSKVICHPLPKAADPDTTDPPADGSPLAAQPLLSSRPSATAVIYLHFTGGTITDPAWNAGNPITANASTLNSTQINEVWQRVAEAFSPFDIDITTDPDRYDNAPSGRRIRAIITPSSKWYSSGSVGGVAYLNSFSQSGPGKPYSSTIPCWIFNPTVKSIADAISHEVGHTLGLEHDGQYSPKHIEYFEGHGTAPMNWGPIMGAPYYVTISQWSKGEYLYANNYEDDIAIITKPANNFTFITEGPGNNHLTAATITNPANFTANAVITNSTDLDYYTFTLNETATITINADPAPIGPNLDIEITLENAPGTTIGSANPPLTLNATLLAPLDPGTYYIKIKGAAYADPLTNGYSTYGSIGQYTLTTAIIPAPPAFPTKLPDVLNAPENGNSTLSALASGNPSPSYQWQYSHNSAWSNLSDDAHHNGTSTNNLTIITPDPSMNGYLYRCIATNTHGSATSSSTILLVIYPPKITTPPADTTIPVGSSTAFTLVATGNPDYRWQVSATNGSTWASLSNTSSHTGITTNTLTITNATLSMNGYLYRCILTNTHGTTTSTPVTLTVTSPPLSLSTLPNTLTIPLNGSSTLTASANGNPTPAYQWQSAPAGTSTWTNLTNDTHHAGTSTHNLTLTNAASTMNGTQYRFAATNTFGSSTSNPTTLLVTTPPSITAQPADKTIPSGTSTTFAITATGVPAPTYQWQSAPAGTSTWTNLPNKSPHAGATTPVLSITNVTPSLHARQYRCIATNTHGTSTSNPATLSITTAPPTITTNLKPEAAVLIGKTITLKIAAKSAPGDKIATYQWTKNNAPTGTSTASLTIKNASASDAAAYRVTITTLTGNSTTSAPCQLWVGEAPKITTQPSPQTHLPNGTSTHNLTLAATGTPPLNYEWTLPNKTKIPATDPALRIPANLNGTYTVTVKNPGASTKSKAAKVTFHSLPTITKQPPPTLAVQTGKTAKISPSIKNTAPAITYQWFLNNTPLNGTSTTPALSLPNAQPTQTGNYHLAATNLAGTSTTNPSYLWIGAPPKITTQPLSAKIPASNPHTLTLAATGDSLVYQWHFNKLPIAGATTDTYTIGTFTASTAGAYHATVQNPLKLLKTSAAKLTLNPATQPQPAQPNNAPPTDTSTKSTTAFNPLFPLLNSLFTESPAPSHFTFTPDNNTESTTFPLNANTPLTENNDGTLTLTTTNNNSDTTTTYRLHPDGTSTQTHSSSPDSPTPGTFTLSP